MKIQVQGSEKEKGTTQVSSKTEKTVSDSKKPVSESKKIESKNTESKDVESKKLVRTNRAKPRKNAGVRAFEGYPLIIVFDPDSGDVTFVDSVTGDYWGMFDPDTNETLIQYPDDTYAPSSGENFLLFRFSNFYGLVQPEVEEIYWQTTPDYYMTTSDVDDDARKSKLRPCPPSSSPSNRPSHAITSRGRFKKPISPRAWAKRTVKDDVPVAVFGVFLIASPYTHVMSTTNMLYNVDLEEYTMGDSPVAFDYEDNFCAVDVESYTEYYLWTVQVTAACSIGGTCTFLITGSIPTLRSSNPLGLQLQCSLPGEVTHEGVRCAGCHRPSIVGVRYQCCECNNFNLCSKCEEAQVECRGHSIQHPMLKIKVPIVARTIHTGVSCDKCGISPIEGTRYKCQICDNFDLCERCEYTSGHPVNHPLIKAKQPLK